MSSKRVTLDGRLRDSTDEPARTPFERDWDRILFSGAFRRMHDKTQVFPLPEDDVTHSRLTHSLEVSSVGRSIGRLVGNTICKNNSLNVTPHDFGAIVAAACLAHDIGNPPFGHAGEDAIATFFRSGPGETLIASLSEREKSDLTSFEGNAQGFRVLTRIQLEADGGLQLCAATLAAFTKYPRASGPDLRKGKIAATKKHGFTQCDRDNFKLVANEVQLDLIETDTSWHRHPLALLVEAADDICYSILDIEDGARLRHLEGHQAIQLMESVACKLDGFDKSRLHGQADKAKIGYLRAMAIGQLIRECAELFIEAEADIMSCKFTSPIADHIPSHAELEALKQLAFQRCYNAPSVVEIELAGYEALGGLLGHFVPAVFTDIAPKARDARPKKEQKALALLRGRNVNVDEQSLYHRILRATDLVSGMTDRHALSTYRKLKGISIPGRIS